jgi:hypothetical protein
VNFEPTHLQVAAPDKSLMRVISSCFVEKSSILMKYCREVLFQNASEGKRTIIPRGLCAVQGEKLPSTEKSESQ